MEYALGFLGGVVVTGAAFAYRYGMSGPSPVSAETFTRMVKDVQMHEIRIGNLELLVGLRHSKKGE